MVTLYSSSIIDEVVNWLGLLVACLASWATVKTMVIAKNDIKPDIRRIKNNVGATLERAKKELIYKKHFKNGAISEEEFEQAVKDTYADIMLLMPYLDKKGKQDEDLYLSEWLFNERSFYDSVNGMDTKEIAYLVYIIRRNIFAE